MFPIVFVTFIAVLYLTLDVQRTVVSLGIAPPTDYEANTMSCTVFTEEHHLQALLDDYHGLYVTRLPTLGRIAPAIVSAKARHLGVMAKALFPVRKATNAY